MPDTTINDIVSRADIETLMDLFYGRVLVDDTIGFIFTDVARLDLGHHLPVITDFWASVLLGHAGYNRNAMQVHLDLHQKVTLETVHFDRWLQLFNAAVDKLYNGPVAGLAKTRAASVAKMIQLKLGLKP